MWVVIVVGFNHRLKDFEDYSVKSEKSVVMEATECTVNISFSYHLHPAYTLPTTHLHRENVLRYCTELIISKLNRKFRLCEGLSLQVVEIFTIFAPENFINPKFYYYARKKQFYCA